MKHLRCMVVDDSLVFRKVLRDCLACIPGVEVIAIAGDGSVALDKLRHQKPDFITLDLDMPVMDGLMLLEKMREESIDTEVLVVSALTVDGAEASVRALSMGALDVLLKPSDSSMQKCIEQLTSQINERISVISSRRSRRGTTQPTPKELGFCHVPTRSVKFSPPINNEIADKKNVSAGSEKLNQTSEKRLTLRSSAGIVVIGISTGGPAALQKLLPALPVNLPIPVVIVQHMPKTFTASLARDLNARSEINVKEAANGDPLSPGVVYIAPAGSQTKVVRRNGEGFIEVNDDPPVRSCKPSVDYLFRSAAVEYASRTLGIIMTGMGNDGTEGAGLIRAAGGRIIAQDEASCTIYGMPKAVFESGAVNQVLSLGDIAPAITRASGLSIIHPELVKV